MNFTADEARQGNALKRSLERRVRIKLCAFRCEESARRSGDNLSTMDERGALAEIALAIYRIIERDDKRIPRAFCRRGKNDRGMERELREGESRVVSFARS